MITTGQLLVLGLMLGLGQLLSTILRVRADQGMQAHRQTHEIRMAQDFGFSVPAPVSEPTVPLDRTLPAPD